ncbi:MAG TPA: DoxX family protein [Methylophilaceae bacterium]
MNRYLAVLGRVLLAQLFLVQVIMMLNDFMNNPVGYDQFYSALQAHGLPGVVAPLIILVQVVGGLALLVGYKTRAVAIIMAVYALFIVLVGLTPAPLQYLAIIGGLLVLASSGETPFSIDSCRKKA